MTRKSKQAGGNLPLTHYERTKKFASSGYGTTALRLSGHSQYRLGDCALSLAPLAQESTAMVTPSGYLYEKNAILEYLLTQTRLLKEQREAYDQQQLEHLESEASRKRSADESRAAELFEEGQSVLKKKQKISAAESQLQATRQDLKRTSYWLADAQNEAFQQDVPPPPERPPSPNSQQPLRRKDMWSVRLCHEGTGEGGRGEGSDSNRPAAAARSLVCAVSHKPLRGDVTAYWIDKKEDGTLVLTSVYNDLIKVDNQCPLTGKRIRETRQLQSSGTSFASSGQQVQLKKYAPTIT